MGSLFKITPRVAIALTAMIAVLSGIEGILALSDAGVLPDRSLRRTAYDWGGFWPGLLSGWEPNFAAQPYIMFLSYSLLHGGIVHLSANMITLWALGGGVAEALGLRRFAVIYLGSVLGGAVGYALLAETVRPMVGASGALFGLAGALMALGYRDLRRANDALWPIAKTAAFLIVINLAMYWGLNGQIAWQTHLGGFLAGWVIALLVDPSRRAKDKE